VLRTNYEAAIIKYFSSFPHYFIRLQFAHNLGTLFPNTHQTILNVISQSLFTEHSFVVGRTGVENKRTMLFYHVARHDGLEKLEMDPIYLIQHFQDRLDLLYYRKVDYQLTGQGQGEELKRNVLVRNISAVVCVCVCDEFSLSPGI
jgi:hypothetical protein